MIRTSFAAAAATALAIAGCGDNPLGRHAISGTVKVDAAPLPAGNISFEPTEGQPVGSGARVSDGRFSIPRDQGLVTGKYRVSINAPIPGTGGQPAADALPGDPPAPPKELIPAEWNSASTHFIEVKKEGPFTFDFEISTKRK